MCDLCQKEALLDFSFAFQTLFDLVDRQFVAFSLSRPLRSELLSFNTSNVLFVFALLRSRRTRVADDHEHSQCWTLPVFHRTVWWTARSPLSATTTNVSRFAFRAS
jgi:hypothetical protein